MRIITGNWMPTSSPVTVAELLELKKKNLSMLVAFLYQHPQRKANRLWPEKPDFYFSVVFLWKKKKTPADELHSRAELASQSNFPPREEQDMHKNMSSPPHFPFPLCMGETHLNMVRLVIMQPVTFSPSLPLTPCLFSLLDAYHYSLSVGREGERKEWRRAGEVREASSD